MEVCMWEELPGAMGEGGNHSGVSVREWPLEDLGTFLPAIL